MKLAILCPTLNDRLQLFSRMNHALDEQINKLSTKNQESINTMALHDDGQYTTGYKRNELIKKAIEWGADYIASFDDDDLPGPMYIQRMLEGAQSGLDCAELWGQYYSNGIKGMPFHHSIQYDHLWQDDKTYFRPPNHLSLVKLSLVKDIPYQDKSWGEDSCWAMDIQKAGVLKTEFPIKEIIYHYYAGFPKHEIA